MGNVCTDQEGNKDRDFSFADANAENKNIGETQNTVRTKHKNSRDNQYQAPVSFKDSSLYQSYAPNNSGEHEPKATIVKEILQLTQLSTEANFTNEHVPEYPEKILSKFAKNPILGPYLYRDTGESYRG